MSPLPIRFRRRSVDYHVPLLISAKPRRPVQIGQQVHLHDVDLPSYTIKTSVARLAWLERGWVIFELEKVHPLASPMFIAVPFTWVHLSFVHRLHYSYTYHTLPGTHLFQIGTTPLPPSFDQVVQHNQSIGKAMELSDLD
ncbi:hypothetical protein SERLA73DRAFT_80825 [Serpula lacrymans var. lacrymans S7.3]|uniref:Uncharacterized protein n=1 Tax=Serpula lacrymans var. lacrymans (strain S7.3) TaxID=936435 RepID=F8QKC0_SERL3|nr:hypothetical protein SERLA73DRAFT_80825 [Serpula lacrymans var. lacrymans S7.3]